VAPNLQALLDFRVVQAIGGATLGQSAMAILRNTFTYARERARAIGFVIGYVRNLVCVNGARTLTPFRFYCLVEWWSEGSDRGAEDAQ
jgi:MFS family permease